MLFIISLFKCEVDNTGPYWVMGGN